MSPKRIKLTKSTEKLINGLLAKWQRASDISNEWPSGCTPTSATYNYNSGVRFARAQCMKELRDMLRTGKLPEWPEIPDPKI